jgi:hypothetical protein
MNLPVRENLAKTTTRNRFPSQSSSKLHNNLRLMFRLLRDTKHLMKDNRSLTDIALQDCILTKGIEIL